MPPDRGPRAARDVHAYTLPVATAAFLLVGALLRLSPPTREASDAVWLAGANGWRPPISR